MRRAFAISIALAGPALLAQAQEGFEPASLPKLLAPSAALATPPAARQFMPPPPIALSAPTSEMLAGRALDHRRSRADCEFTTSDLCFDMRERKPVYRGVREYMPTFEGLRPESVSLKREGIVFKYSFK